MNPNPYILSPTWSQTPGSGVIMWPPVSVCHQVSTTGQRPPPMTSLYQRQASGLMGSPTLPRICRQKCWRGVKTYLFPGAGGSRDGNIPEPGCPQGLREWQQDMYGRGAGAGGNCVLMTGERYYCTAHTCASVPETNRHSKALRSAALFPLWSLMPPPGATTWCWSWSTRPRSA